jgi:hypothetical protein
MTVALWKKVVSVISVALFGVAQFTVGDAIGWLGVITAFILVWSLIWWLWRRAHGSSGDALELLLARIAAYDKRIDSLESEIKKLKAERDELKRQAREYADLRKELEDYMPLNDGLKEVQPVSPLLVAIGSDAMLKLDLASLRAVETDTGMEFRRIENASFAELKRRLDRARGLGTPYDKLHLAVHSGPQGIVLGGELVDSIELSEILRGVRVMVIAGCQSSQIGEFLGVVPYVVSMNEDVDNKDAALFARAFWTQIGKKLEPTQALREALKRSPSGMSEYIERHW